MQDPRVLYGEAITHIYYQAYDRAEKRLIRALSIAASCYHISLKVDDIPKLPLVQNFEPRLNLDLVLNLLMALAHCCSHTGKFSMARDAVNSSVALLLKYGTDIQRHNLPFLYHTLGRVYLFAQDYRNSRKWLVKAQNGASQIVRAIANRSTEERVDKNMRSVDKQMIDLQAGIVEGSLANSLALYNSINGRSGSTSTATRQPSVHASSNRASSAQTKDPSSAPDATQIYRRNNCVDITLADKLFRELEAECNHDLGLLYHFLGDVPSSLIYVKLAVKQKTRLARGTESLAQSLFILAELQTRSPDSEKLLDESVANLRACIAIRRQCARRLSKLAVQEKQQGGFTGGAAGTGTLTGTNMRRTGQLAGIMTGAGACGSRGGSTAGFPGKTTGLSAGARNINAQILQGKRVLTQTLEPGFYSYTYNSSQLDLKLADACAVLGKILIFSNRGRDAEPYVQEAKRLYGNIQGNDSRLFLQANALLMRCQKKLVPSPQPKPVIGPNRRTKLKGASPSLYRPVDSRLGESCDTTAIPGDILAPAQTLQVSRSDSLDDMYGSLTGSMRRSHSTFGPDKCAMRAYREKKQWAALSELRRATAQGGRPNVALAGSFVGDSDAVASMQALSLVRKMNDGAASLAEADSRSRSVGPKMWRGRPHLSEILVGDIVSRYKTAELKPI